MDYRKKLIVEPGSEIKLGTIDAAFHGDHETHAAALGELQEQIARLTHLQYLLYAEKKRALLVVLQGIDAAGKDGTWRGHRGLDRTDNAAAGAMGVYRRRNRLSLARWP
jgi:polyphosphate kinase 2 (PPK2 family)